MKFLPGPKRDPADRTLTFQIETGEQTLLLALLRMYPVLQPPYHRLSKDPKNAGSPEQQLLEESMAQQRAAHQRKLEELLKAPQRHFKEAEGRRRLVLTGVQFEWLLQVLNDIRVGSWVRLGCPDMEQAASPQLNRAAARSFQAMHLSGQFQAALLEAVK